MGRVILGAERELIKYIVDDKRLKTGKTGHGAMRKKEPYAIDRKGAILSKIISISRILGQGK